MEYQKIRNLLDRLLECPSISPNNAGCLEIVAGELDGFNLQRIDLADTANLFASYGQGFPHISFVGHIDVVPANPAEWTSNPFIPTERDGKIFARGAADMKSGVAATVIAAKYLAKLMESEKITGTISLLITSDEEATGLNGIAAVMPILAERGINIDYAIVAEPTARENLGDCARKGRRGSLNLELEIVGIEGHIAYPEKLRNPIFPLAEILARLGEIVWDTGYLEFPPTSCQVSNFQAGLGAENVVPRTARAKINWRFNPLYTEEKIRQIVEKIVAEVCEKSTTANFSWRLSGDAFATADEIICTALSDAVKENLGTTLEFNTAGGTSDGRFLAKHGAKVVEFGVCNASIHKADEWVKAADLEPLAKIYFDCAKNIFTHFKNTK
ncbi:MAG: succinyl-diaminopimelate desuccinylase [Cardiobacteriaceae bacterium]|nr:succinyl-diaminopimelate desuccinylase [Cardiobacteriaceae bacterium]